MITAIIQALASGISWLAAKGVDNIIGKWLAYFVIAFEERASEKAKLAFAETLGEIKKSMPEKAKAWETWRKRAETAPGPKGLV